MTHSGCAGSKEPTQYSKWLHTTGRLPSGPPVTLRSLFIAPPSFVHPGSQVITFMFLAPVKPAIRDKPPQSHHGIFPPRWLGWSFIVVPELLSELFNPARRYHRADILPFRRFHYPSPPAETFRYCLAHFLTWSQAGLLIDRISVSKNEHPGKILEHRSPYLTARGPGFRPGHPHRRNPQPLGGGYSISFAFRYAYFLPGIKVGPGIVKPGRLSRVLHVLRLPVVQPAELNSPDAVRCQVRKNQHPGKKLVALQWLYHHSQLIFNGNLAGTYTVVTQVFSSSVYYRGA